MSGSSTVTRGVCAHECDTIEDWGDSSLDDRGNLVFVGQVCAICKDFCLRKNMTVAQLLKLIQAAQAKQQDPPSKGLRIFHRVAW